MSTVMLLAKEIIRIARRARHAAKRSGKRTGLYPCRQSLIMTARAVIKNKYGATDKDIGDASNIFEALAKRDEPFFSERYYIVARRILRATRMYTTAIARISRKALYACGNPFPQGITMAAVLAADYKNIVPPAYLMEERRADCATRGHTV